MLRLEELIFLENTKLGYKMENKLLPLKLTRIMLSDSKSKSLLKRHQYSTRNKHIPNLPVAQNKTYHASFLFQYTKDYKKLTPEIRNSNNIKSFINKVKRHILMN